MISKAPKGGIVSQVNGQFYEGGEFVPDHGQYCGKGKNRVTKVKFDEVASLIGNCGHMTGRLEYQEAFDRFVIKNPGGNILMTTRNLSTFAKAFTK